jgi:hypothetical protein
VTVAAYALLAAGAALLLFTRWRITKTTGVVLCYVAGVTLAAHMPGGTAHNVVTVTQRFLLGWEAVPTILTVIVLVVVAWHVLSGSMNLLTGVLALALPALLPYLATGPLHELWAWATGTVADTWHDVSKNVRPVLENAKPLR